MTDSLSTAHSATDRYLVFGNPISHSKSPWIHGLFAAETGEKLDYDKQCIEIGDFERQARQFFNSGGKGLNVTVPFKQEAYRFADKLTPGARRAGAVNTLALQPDGTVLGDNTDGVGLIRDLVENLGWPIQHKRVLVLGAGGAVRGVLEPLLAQGPSMLVVANRSIDRVIQLTRAVADQGPVEGCGYDGLPGRQFDLVINGTSASMSGQVPPLPDDLLAANARCYDLFYAAEPTVFMLWAEAHGAVAVADGLGMLVEQAAEAFSLWRGKRPDSLAVIDALRKATR